ncbi:MAG: hypothetical protein HW380_3877 [Magnetococcales bacterium]|nr:hypothetical protein [Magnetococcales bacterium]
MVDCKNSGFSLVEISVVILIVAVLLGSSVVSYSKMNDKQQRQKTEYLIEEVQRALIGYAITNGYLPCPDVGVDINNATQPAFDGGEDRDPLTNDCRLVYGVLPWKDLGVREFDFYGNHLSYHVDPLYSERAIPCNHTPGVLNVDVIDQGVTTNYNMVAAVVVSFGKNGLGHLSRVPAGPSAYVSHTSVAGSTIDADYLNGGASASNNNYIQKSGDDILTFVSPISLRSHPEMACQ